MSNWFFLDRIMFFPCLKWGVVNKWLYFVFFVRLMLLPCMNTCELVKRSFFLVCPCFPSHMIQQVLRFLVFILMLYILCPQSISMAATYLLCDFCGDKLCTFLFASLIHKEKKFITDGYGFPTIMISVYWCLSRSCPLYCRLEVEIGNHHDNPSSKPRVHRALFMCMNWQSLIVQCYHNNVHWIGIHYSPQIKK